MGYALKLARYLIGEVSEDDVDGHNLKTLRSSFSPTIDNGYLIELDQFICDKIETKLLNYLDNHPQIAAKVELLTREEAHAKLLPGDV